MLKDKLTLGNKLIALIVLPLIGVAILGTRDYLRSSNVSEKISELQQMTQLVGRLSGVVHHSQKERGATAGYLGSNGKKFSTELPVLREETDTRIAELEAALAATDSSQLGEEFQLALKSATDMLQQLQTTRKGVDALTIPANQAIG